MTDPVADMLTRIRNANERYHSEVIMYSSKVKEQIARILQEQGYIEGFHVQAEESHKRTLTVKLKYKGKRGRERVIHGLERISRPGRRIYVGAGEIPQVMGGLGITVLSTSQGLMSGHEARTRRIGGEVVCHIW
jgi:small subunit ribosomal protein S8